MSRRRGLSAYGPAIVRTCFIVCDHEERDIMTSTIGRCSSRAGLIPRDTTQSVLPTHSFSLPTCIYGNRMIDWKSDPLWLCLARKAVQFSEFFENTVS